MYVKLKIRTPLYIPTNFEVTSLKYSIEPFVFLLDLYVFIINIFIFFLYTTVQSLPNLLRIRRACNQLQGRILNEADRLFY